MEEMTAEEFDHLAATGEPVELRVNLIRPGRLFTMATDLYEGPTWSSPVPAPGNAVVRPANGTSSVLLPA